MRMEKIFKGFLAALSCMLVAAMVAFVVAMPIYKDKKLGMNFFESNRIIDSIKNLELDQTSIIYVKDQKGNWVEYKRLHGQENRIWVDLEKMPENLKNAFIAIEDKTFYKHNGVNWKRTFGAVSNYFFKFDESEFGGSTITQQLIKNLTDDKDKLVSRKVREIVRALVVDGNLDKDIILEAYLNTIALGNGIHGVQVAANYYFNKDVSELSLSECAALAAITQNPTKYNPITETGLENNDIRRNTVLDEMLELEMISYQDYSLAYNKRLVLDTSQRKNQEFEINNYFVDALIEQVIEDFAAKYKCSEKQASSMLYNGGYKIYSTVDTNIQNIMEDVYLNTGKYFKYRGLNLKGESVHVQSAMTIMDYEGHIVGIVGGAGEKTENRGLNRATSAPRQPGSTMKPIGVYALAIEKDIVHYTSIVKDEPIKNYFGTGKSGPREWYGYYKGNITIDYAIRKSANTIPVKLLEDVGVEESYNFLTQKLHCKYLNEIDKNASSLALGGCRYGITTTESAAAFAIFGNQGVYHKPTTYHKIEDSKGKVVLEYNTKGEQVISDATATIMNHLLQGVVYGSEGTGSGIRSFSSMKAYAKTGTSSESNDLWMVAGSPYYIGSVWYGFDKQQQVNSTSAAATVWRDIMKRVHQDLEKKSFVDSENVYKKGSGYYKNGTKPDNTKTTSGSDKKEETPTTTTPPATTPPVTTPPTGGTTTTPPTGGTTPTPTEPSTPEQGGTTPTNPPQTPTE